LKAEQVRRETDEIHRRAHTEWVACREDVQTLLNPDIPWDPSRKPARHSPSPPTSSTRGATTEGAMHVSSPCEPR
jgi:hypothetical protein